MQKPTPQQVSLRMKHFICYYKNDKTLRGGGDWQITAEGAFFLCNLRFMSKLYNATDNKGLHTTRTPQRIHVRLSPYIRLLLQR